MASRRKAGRKKNQYYGSDKRQGDLKSFWSITFYSLHVHLIDLDSFGIPILSDLEFNEKRGEYSMLRAYSHARSEEKWQHIWTLWMSGVSKTKKPLS